MASFAEPITIATTIAPTGDLSNQQKAIQTWISCGFKVLAVNTSEEISVLKPFFPAIEFITAKRDSSNKYQKPYIYFDDLLDCLNHHSTHICGIVNSDIHFLNTNLYPFIGKEAHDSFLFGSRIDIASLDLLESGKPYAGFDYFFFDKKIISCFPHDEFCIGLPWWDYWIILMPLAYKIPLKMLVTPCAYHLIHTPGNLDTNSWIPLGLRLAAYFSPSFTVSAETMGLYNHIMYSFIANNQHIQHIECI